MIDEKNGRADDRAAGTLSSDAIMEEFGALLQKLALKEGGGGVNNKINRLKTLLDSLLKPEEFKVGDIVVWRNGLKNRKFPDYGEPVIVVEVLTPPLVDETNDSGSTYYKEPLSLKLGTISDEGDLITFLYDGRRFEHYQDAGDRLRHLLSMSDDVVEGSGNGGDASS